LSIQPKHIAPITALIKEEVGMRRVLPAILVTDDVEELAVLCA
jgi:hypothetical protein